MKYRRYAAYKESGIEWLGEVPSHWGIVQSRRLFALRKSLASPTDRQLTAAQKYGVIFQDDFIEREGRRVVQVITGSDILKHVEPNDFVISMRSFQGGIEGCKYRGSISSAYVVLIPSEQVDFDYFTYLFKCGPYIQALQSTSNLVRDGQALRYENFTLVHLPLIPLDEQRQIASFLRKETAQIDTLIARQERLLAVLQEKRQALISHAVTKGLDRQAAMKESGVEWLGEVPSHWEVKRLKHIAHVQTGAAKGRDLAGQPTMQVPYLRVANVQDGYLDLTDVALIEIAVSELERYRLQPGDVLMNEGGDNDKLGRGHVWRGEVEVCIHQNHVFAVRPHGVDPEWLSLVTGADYAKFYFYSFAKQSTNLASISSSNLRELPILCPPVAERDVIRSYIAVETALIDQLMQKAEAAVAKLQERRAALISAAVTGKIDVRGGAGRALPEGLAISTGVTG